MPGGGQNSICHLLHVFRPPPCNPTWFVAKPFPAATSTQGHGSLSLATPVLSRNTTAPPPSKHYHSIVQHLFVRFSLPFAHPPPQDTLNKHLVRSASRPCRRCEAAPSSGTPWGTCPPAEPAGIKDRDSSILITVFQHSCSICTALLQHRFSAAAVAQRGPRALLPTRCACIPVTGSTNQAS